MYGRESPCRLSSNKRLMRCNWDNWHMLDNEAPELLKMAICENECTIELTPTDMHRAMWHKKQSRHSKVISLQFLPGS
ncbi:hypothetical protein ACHAW6_007458 [Cyclotella cf. meneghiniana]